MPILNFSDDEPKLPLEQGIKIALQIYRERLIAFFLTTVVTTIILVLLVILIQISFFLQS